MKIKIPFVKNQKGFGLLMAVITIGIIVAGFGITTSQLFLNTQDEAARYKRGIEVIQFMQEIGAMVQEANRKYNDHIAAGNPAGSCPAGYTNKLNVFCFANGTSCVKAPGFVDAFPRTLCIDNGFDLSFMPVEDSVPKWRRWWEQGKEKAVAFLRNAVRFEVAQATGSDNVGRDNGLPVLPISGLPVLSIDPSVNTTCDNSTPGSTLCKRCTGGVGTQNVECVLIRACLVLNPNDGTPNCTDSSHYVYQRFGVIL